MKGGVVQSLVVWGVALPGPGKKTSPETQSVSIAPFHKQLLYTDKNPTLDCGQFMLRRTIDPVGQTSPMFTADHNHFLSFTTAL
jgi:hypothetical protein